LISAHFLRLVCLSGLANAAVLAVVNMSVQSTSHGKSGLLRGLVLFCLAIGIYVVSQKRLMVDTCGRVEDLIVRLRWRLLVAVRNSEYHEVERIGRSEIFGNLSRETHVLSQSTPNLIVAVQSAVLLVASMTYMFFLSKMAFFLLAIFTTVGAIFHLSRSKLAGTHIQDAARNDDTLIEGFSDLIDGFREVKLNRARSIELADAISAVSTQSRNSRLLVHTLNAHDFVLSQLTFFVLTGLMVFIVPAFGSADSKTITMTTTATLFMLGPVGALVGNFPVFNNANEAAKRIRELEDKLTSTSRSGCATDPIDTFADFQEIVLDQLAYSYPSPAGETSFSVGPNSLHIKRGDCIFITGGNGSGKTTFTNLLLTLIPASGGNIVVDGTTVRQSDLAAYRNLFSVIFSDNHLFKTLYGAEPFTAHEAEELLAAMEIGHKVEIRDNRYSNTELSGGQRKRIALVTAQLERKPVLVLDEWAADQDPVFREKFYRQIIPALRGRGYTIIAITHDDRYFDVADARYHMADGKLDRLA
jgi:putative ATP-binding cassette transporter